MKTIRLFKMRTLTSCIECEKIIQILKTGEFWCSSFSEFNDPMEGVFASTSQENLEKLTSRKNQFKICSFTNSYGVTNPLLWGYYSGGFKGVAIEIEIELENVSKVEYKKSIPAYDSRSDDALRSILSTKLTPWKHEKEYRFICKSEMNLIKIGDIKCIYYFCPYGNVDNHREITASNSSLFNYYQRVECIKRCVPDGIRCIQASYDQEKNKIKIKTNS